jgi:hypothetical protein
MIKKWGWLHLQNRERESLTHRIKTKKIPAQLNFIKPYLDILIFQSNFN